VVLFPWTANVTDKIEDSTLNEAQYDKLVTDELNGENGQIQLSKSRKLTYYQVLIDNRDIPYIRAQPESVTFLGGPQKNRSVYSIHGLDYVSQNDVLPYTSTEKVPIIHDLFDKFLMQDTDSSRLCLDFFILTQA
jgi:polymerase delta-interacting protein 2